MVKNKLVVLGAVSALTVLVGAGVVGATSLFNNPSVVEKSQSVPLATWQGKDKVMASDNIRAQATFHDVSTKTPESHTWVSEYLKATGFNLSVPANATITGIEVEIEKNATSVGGEDWVGDYSVRLIKGGVMAGHDLARRNDKWPYQSNENSPAAVYGSSTQMWNLSLTPADVNSADFGVAIAAVRHKAKNDGVPNATAFIDNIRVQVHYTVPE